MNPPDAPKKNDKKNKLKSNAQEPDSFVDSLKNEWSLFWENFVGDDEVPKELLPDQAVLTIEQIKAVTKALSSDRKKLNLKLEEIRKEIEESAMRLETLKLVGSPADETLQRLGELSDQGQSVNEKLNKVNERLRLARRREDEIKKAVRLL
jgi:chromosome segregation ATPase